MEIFNQKTFQERLADENDPVDEELFSTLMDLGFDPNLNASDSISKIRQLDSAEVWRLNQAFIDALDRRRRRSWKNPHRIDPQQGARGQVIAKAGGGN